MAGVGLCHSDFLFLDTPPGIIPWELPFTLGHESAGWVEQLGADVDDLELGQPVAVAGHPLVRALPVLPARPGQLLPAWCERARVRRGRRPGPVPRGPPARAGAAHARSTLAGSGLLTDAGATSYHAVKRALPKLIPGSDRGRDRRRWPRLVRGAVPPATHRRAGDRGRPRAAAPRPRTGARRPRRARSPTTRRRRAVRELTGGLGAPPRCSTSSATTRPWRWRWRARQPRHHRDRGRGRWHRQGVVGRAAARVRPLHPDGGVDRRPPRGDRVRGGGRAARRGGAVRVRRRARRVRAVPRDDLRSRAVVTPNG